MHPNIFTYYGTCKISGTLLAVDTKILHDELTRTILKWERSAWLQIFASVMLCAPILLVLYLVSSTGIEYRPHSPPEP
jgi:hypothetical protein